MDEDEYVALAGRSLADATFDEFDRRVDEQADRLAEAVRAGRLDSPGFALGIELETYAIDGTGQLARIPDAVFESPGDKELGRHNVELHTDPDPLDGDGIAAQAAALRENYRQVQAAADEAGVEIVLDAMWTVPPAAGTRAYFADVTRHGDVTVAENMTPSPRYYAIDSHVLANGGGSIPLSVPGVETAFPSILYESLTSSIQPHVQVPDTESFPRYYDAAIRTLGPVLALATNSPLLPHDLYGFDDEGSDNAGGGDGVGRGGDNAGGGDGVGRGGDNGGGRDGDNGGGDEGDPSGPVDPYELLEETYHELRIPVFEQSVNRGWEKVRFPDDVRTAADTVDALVDDPTCAPFLREWLVAGERETFPDRFWELDHKRGTYWRWLRAVAGGQPVGGGDRWSLRIEYRPLPTQPTIDENVGLQCLVAGLLRGLVAADHPLATIPRDTAAASLPRDAAERSFYSAVEHGLDADLAWVTADGERTDDPDEIYDELFTLARRGLREQGVPDETVERFLEPIEARWTGRTTPSRWKLARVRERLDAGDSFDEAVRAMQAAYVERSAAGEPVVEWS